MDSMTHPAGMRLSNWTGILSRGRKSSVAASGWKHRHASYCRAPWEASGNHHTASSMASTGRTCRNMRSQYGNILDLDINANPFPANGWFILSDRTYTWHVSNITLSLSRPPFSLCFIPILVVSLWHRSKLSFVLFSPLNGPSHFIELSLWPPLNESDMKRGCGALYCEDQLLVPARKAARLIIYAFMILIRPCKGKAFIDGHTHLASYAILLLHKEI